MPLELAALQALPFTVLVADDNILIRELVGAFLRSEDYVVCSADDGAQALAVAEQCRPDLILLDRHMPGLASVEVIRSLKVLSGKRWVPLIVVSADDSQESQVEALDNGADDYITKPINFKILAAKLRVFRHHVHLQTLLAAQREELQRHRDRSEQELTTTRFLMQRLMRADKLDDVRVRHWLAPAENFSGDLLAAACSHTGELYGLLADATGHGLSAAVNLIPLTQTFYAMVKKGFSLASIAAQMNLQLRQYTPPERFVAVTLVQVNARDCSVEVLNAGNPAVLLLDTDGAIVRTFRSRSIPLGIRDEQDMAFDTERMQYTGDCQLVLYSDGLIEAGEDTGDAFGFERLATALRAGADTRLGAVQSALRLHCGDRPGHDDISLLLLDCAQVSAAVAPAATAQPPVTGSLWRIELTLSEEQLRHIDLVPTLLDWSQLMGLPAQQSGTFFAVMTELYANALDHGVLGLDSRLKQGAGGYELYMSERQRSLAALQRGRIVIGLAHERAGGGNRLRIRVRDSGAGFDAAAWQHSAVARADQFSGRGIALVRSLCSRLEYSADGTDALAEIVY